ncbi:hypothetical protein [Bradyrhizobium sp. ORS 285]|uniref:hypothetical protein n=1 Tax=Bradyrhizobium sp. ORS 285 TaxID=115808 RepID=UPI000240AC53|nr:hypothetical protein [Bradyrhizobium sp. ORS 285]CCD89372.1 conserved hypothetical protein [Bradyrhizobium sp. ORS 285]
MSDGHYCLVRDLGLVKGGKGMRYHEVVVDFSYRGIKLFAKQGALALMRRVAAKLAQHETTSKLPALLRVRLREPQ